MTADPRAPQGGAGRSLLDAFMPDFDVMECHALVIPASPQAVFQAVERLDLGRSRVVRALFALRSLPARLRGDGRSLGLDMAALCEAGFVRLGEEPGREIVLGIAGRFWSLVPRIERLAPDAFVAYQTPGNAKAAWNFVLSPGGPGGVRLVTETRVKVLGGPIPRALFRTYWLFVRPFSGIVRMFLLRCLRDAALASEREARPLPAAGEGRERS